VGVLEILARGCAAAPEAVPFGEVVEAALRRTAALLAARGLVVRRGGGVGGGVLFGNREELEELLATILGEAALLAGPGPVDLSCREAGGRAEIEVRVRSSLPARSAESLFRLGAGPDGSPRSSTLFVARWSTEGLGGRLDAVSEDDELVFRASLPAA
jgi:hypothetical protein